MLELDGELKTRLDSTKLDVKKVAFLMQLEIPITANASFLVNVGRFVTPWFLLLFVCLLCVFLSGEGSSRHFAAFNQAGSISVVLLIQVVIVVVSVLSVS